MIEFLKSLSTEFWLSTIVVGFAFPIALLIVKKNSEYRKKAWQYISSHIDSLPNEWMIRGNIYLKQSYNHLVNDMQISGVDRSHENSFINLEAFAKEFYLNSKNNNVPLVHFNVKWLARPSIKAIRKYSKSAIEIENCISEKEKIEKIKSTMKIKDKFDIAMKKIRKHKNFIYA